MHDLDYLINNSTESNIQLPLKDADVIYYPTFLSGILSDELFEFFMNETHWQQDDIRLFGKTYPQPRLTALYGNNGKTYTYSGIEMKPHPFLPAHENLLKKMTGIDNTEYTTVLLNLYRDGSDSNGWHSDDEKELGNNPSIASFSFGAERVFHFKHKEYKEERYKFTLKHGSLLLMQGATQHYWQHQLPKSKRIKEARINLTFRKII